MIISLFQLINQKCLGDPVMVEVVMNSLLGRLVDSSHIVRMLCIRGLGNVSSLGQEQVSDQWTPISSLGQEQVSTVDPQCLQSRTRAGKYSGPSLIRTPHLSDKLTVRITEYPER